MKYLKRVEDMKKFNLYLYIYELKCAIVNGFSFFFGLVFPILLATLISLQLKNDVPSAYLTEAKTVIFLAMASVIPLSVSFVSYSAVYSNEVVAGVPERLNLYGYSFAQMFLAKILANLTFVSIALLIFIIYGFAVLGIINTSIVGWLGFLLFFYTFTVALNIFSHGVTNLCRNFGLTYLITMSLYFLMMIFSGLMGLQVDNLPPKLLWLSDLMPPKYLRDGFIEFWKGNEYIAAPLIQATLFWFVLALLILLFSHLHLRRKKEG